MDYGIIALFAASVAVVLAMISLMKHQWSATHSGVDINDIAMAKYQSGNDWVETKVSIPLPAAPAKVTRAKKPRARKTTASRPKG